MAKAVHVEDLSPDNAGAILDGLQKRASVPIPVPSKIPGAKIPPPIKANKFWYVSLMMLFVYLAAYMLLGLGWFMKHLGEGIYILGDEMKRAARNID